MAKIKKRQNRKKTHQLQLIAILLMLLLIAAALAWLTVRGRSMNKERTTEVIETIGSAEKTITEETAVTDDLTATMTAHKGDLFLQALLIAVMDELDREYRALRG